MTSQENVSLANDEIDLKELILNLWKGKWLIATTTLIAVLAGLAYILFIQTTTAKLEIKEIPSYQINSYNEVNTMLNRLSDSIDSFKNFQILPTYPDIQINSNFLISNLMQRASSREDLIKVAKNLNFPPKNKLSDEAWDEQVTNFIYNINFLRPSTETELANNKSPNPRLHWEISSNGIKDRIAYKKLITESFNASTEYLRLSILNNIQREIRLLNTLEQQEIENIDSKIANLKETYQQQLNQTKAQLQEQAQIARKLNIAKNSLEVEKFNNTPNVISVSNTSPLYFRGYEALEEELALLDARENIEVFIPELINLYDRKRDLASANLENRLHLAIKNSPLNSSEHFIAAVIDTNAIKFETKPNKFILLFLMAFLGLMIGSIIALLKAMFSKNNQK